MAWVRWSRSGIWHAVDDYSLLSVKGDARTLCCGRRVPSWREEERVEGAWTSREAAEHGGRPCAFVGPFESVMAHQVDALFHYVVFRALADDNVAGLGDLMKEGRREQRA